MAYVIRIAGTEAKLEKGRWTCPDAFIEDLLNRHMEIAPCERHYSPTSELDLVRDTADCFGGELVDPPASNRWTSPPRVNGVPIIE